MAEQSVTVTLGNGGAQIEARYSDNITTVTVSTSYAFKDGSAFTVDQLRESPAHMARTLLGKIVPPLTT